MHMLQCGRANTVFDLLGQRRSQLLAIQLGQARRFWSSTRRLREWVIFQFRECCCYFGNILNHKHGEYRCCYCPTIRRQYVPIQHPSMSINRILSSRLSRWVVRKRRAMMCRVCSISALVIGEGEQLRLPLLPHGWMFGLLVLKHQPRNRQTGSHSAGQEGLT